MNQIFAIAALVVLCLAGGAFASVESSSGGGCTTLPPQFTAGMRMMILKDNCATLYEIGYIYYDYVGQQVRVDVSGSINNATNFTASVYQFYSEQTEYIMDRGSGTCYKQALNSTLSSNTLPSNAQVLGQVTLGSEVLDLMWISTGTSYGVEVTLTSNCFLVGENIFNTTSSGDTELIASYDYWNFVPMVPSYFNELPAECNNAQVIDRHTTEMHLSPLLATGSLRPHF
eukprot:TRINITY_DN111_c0_g1_i1.p1 TRINITY_DN111_c0_g1~~TRINITY_DN111_c0_g1_i1.p1  ORF type:complete len:257 (+),score=62.09 TRINITY_DN111_c0_g1_i1:86-772(+)